MDGAWDDGVGCGSKLGGGGGRGTPSSTGGGGVSMWGSAVRWGRADSAWGGGLVGAGT